MRKAAEVNLSDYATLYVQRRDGSPGYLDQLRWTISAFERFAGRPLQLDDLTEQLINDYLWRHRDALAPSTRRNRRNMIVRLWRHAAHDPLLDSRPRQPVRDALAHVRQVQTIPRAWSADQVRRLLGVAGGLRGKYGGRLEKSAYWRSWILADWDLGWRGCDMRAFPVAAVAARVTIVQRKTGRVVHGALRQEARDAIRDFLGRDDREFVWPLWCRLSTWRVIARRLVARAGLPGSIGWLRHSAATACENAHPGQGYQFLGNTPDVFYAHYYDRSHGDLPQPPELL